MMETKKLSVENLLVFVAFALGLAIRLASLGTASLLNPEANLALQALSFAQGKTVSLGAQPGYVMGTGLLFYLFGGANFLARFLPAVVGSLLILSPLLVRKQLGRLPMLLLIFALALDPGLVAVSRTASAEMMALSLGVMALVFWQAHKPAAGGIALGLGLLCGASFWLGFFGFSVSVLVFWILNSKKIDSEEGTAESASAIGFLKGYPQTELRRFMLFTAGTFLVAGSGLLLVMRGLSAALNGFAEFWQGWTVISTVNPGRLLGSIGLYEIFPFILAVIAFIEGVRKRESLSLFLGLWFGVSLFLACMYPARTVDMLVWSLVPLWTLAVRTPSRWLVESVEDPAALAAQSVLIFVVLIYAWQNILGLVNITEAAQFQLRYLSLGAALALLVLATLLVGWGWKPQVARLGLAAGASMALILYTLSVLFGAAGLRGQPTAELWQPEIRGQDWTLLEQTVSDLSRWKLGDPNALAVTVVGEQNPAMVWMLRNHVNVTYTASLPVDNQAAIVIASEQFQGSLETAYRGQRFVIREWMERGSLLSGDMLSYVLYRKAPLQQEAVILWARGDIFPTSGLTGAIK